MKKVLLFGGHGDIGSAIYKKFIQNGYEVFAPSSKEVDLADFTQIENYLASLPDGIDTLIFSAGHNNPAEIGTLSVEEMKKTWYINCLSWAFICSKLRPSLEKNGNGYILAVSSLYGTISREGRAAYAMSKHALNGLIQTLALELGAAGIKCNTLSPGFVYTKMTEKNNTPSMIETIERKIPLGKMASVEDIAEVAFFLASAKNTYITGQDIIVDGGFMAGGFQHT